MSDMPKQTKKTKTPAELWAQAYGKYHVDRHGSEAALAAQALRFGDLGAVMRMCARSPEILTQPVAGAGLLLDLALSEKSHAIAIGLISLGAWASRPIGMGRPSQQTPPFEDAIGDLWKALAKHAPDCIWLDAATAALARSGRPFPDPEAWRDLLLEGSRFALATNVNDHHGLAPDPAVGARLDAQVATRGLGHALIQATGSTLNSETNHAAWRLVEELSSSWTPPTATALWAMCLKERNLESADKLIRLGIAPPAWSMPAKDASFGPSSLLVAAAAAKAHDIFDCLKAMPDALAAAASARHSPRDLSQCSPADLASLARIGVDIATTNMDGMNFLHLWARSDAEPRDGWRTVCKLRPDLLTAKDMHGQTPAHVQRVKLGGKKKDSFEGIIASIERSAIVKDLGRDLPEQTPPARKARL